MPKKSDLTARDVILGVAVLGCGLLAMLAHWAWFRGQGAPPLGLTIAIALLAAALAAVVLRSWASWLRLRSARRETDARFADLDRAVARARRLARPDQVTDEGEAVDPGADLEMRRGAATDSGQATVDADLELMRREWLRDQQVLEAMRDSDALRAAWRRKFGADAPDPGQVMRMLDELLRSPSEESPSQRSP